MRLGPSVLDGAVVRRRSAQVGDRSTISRWIHIAKTKVRHVPSLPSPTRRLVRSCDAHPTPTKTSTRTNPLERIDAWQEFRSDRSVRPFRGPARPSHRRRCEWVVAANRWFPDHAASSHAQPTKQQIPRAMENDPSDRTLVAIDGRTAFHTRSQQSVLIVHGDFGQEHVF